MALCHRKGLNQSYGGCPHAAVRKVPPLVEDGAPPQLVGVTQTSGTATGAPGTVFLAIDSVVTEGLQALSEAHHVELVQH